VVSAAAAWACGDHSGVGGSAAALGGQVLDVELMPSPAEAERNQARKRAFIPVWPIVAAGAVMLVMALFLR
jgi:hypothetical protein